MDPYPNRYFRKFNSWPKILTIWLLYTPGCIYEPFYEIFIGFKKNLPVGQNYQLFGYYTPLDPFTNPSMKSLLVLSRLNSRLKLSINWIFYTPGLIYGPFYEIFIGFSKI